ncbi:hypothetical protein [Lichenihabitans psoromatis]|uniref:hypothetical protein n=1 Tax=Lichenihabitans psoromatis TaxID=2528642 RepID=UPI001035CA0D|nr:hypothetical protein [Lichenihabitans psoromatis]
MMFKLSKGAVLATLALGGLAAQTIGASAMPMVDLNPAAVAHSGEVSGVQETRWVCGPYRCFWRPNYGYYGPRPVYGPRPFYGHPYGWHRPWGYGGYHHYGWHRRWHRW